MTGSCLCHRAKLLDVLVVKKPLVSISRRLPHFDPPSHEIGKDAEHFRNFTGRKELVVTCGLQNSVP